jgi:hypothetical protein
MGVAAAGAFAAASGGVAGAGLTGGRYAFFGFLAMP